jgi:hypothetical protein
MFVVYVLVAGSLFLGWALFLLWALVQVLMQLAKGLHRMHCNYRDRDEHAPRYHS